MMNRTLLSPYFESVKWLFIAEFFVIGVLLLFIFISRPLLIYFKRRKERRYAVLKESLLLCIQQCTDYSGCLPSYVKTIAFLLPLIIEIDKTINEASWDKIKKSIFETILFPQARRLAYAKTWLKRIHAVRCFLHLPDPSNETHVLHLLRDQTPIVQYSAAFCAAKLGTEQCANAVIDAMNQSDRFLRHPFREALLKGESSIFAYIEKRLERDENPLTRVSCLEVLAEHMNAHVAELAMRDLHAQHKNLRIAAIRALGHFPDPKSEAALIVLLKDAEWEVRAISARALGYLEVKEAVAQLSDLLRDDVWWVRMNAALALKRLGTEGKKALERQKLQENKNAYEIAQYVLPLND